MYPSHYITLGCACLLLLLLMLILIIRLKWYIRVLPLEAKPIGDVSIAMCVLMFSFNYYKELAQPVMEAGKFKSAVWASRLKTQGLLIMLVKSEGSLLENPLLLERLVF